MARSCCSISLFSPNMVSDEEYEKLKKEGVDQVSKTYQQTLK
ncbi:hypothetical protein [Paraflavitalea sp. CAU 1676]|nr:hypothetical protein [Paraflavitalea sp. CAU 1676]MDF2188157.1 hypothetical protein [Paraflavitalea sp. CAU 1676]